MRLGGPVMNPFTNPEEWISELKKLGYRAAYCPVGNDASDSLVEDYVNAAEKADIVIAEVGVWNNPLSPDSGEREAALAFNRKQLELAERVGANCCVNISGSRGKKWDGPHPENLTEDTFALIVDTVRSIIDEVKPTRTFYVLEPMPWSLPDTPDAYLRLIKAIDRKAFAVHMDIVNMVNSPSVYFNNAQFIRECFSKLGAHIKSCHLKDIVLGEDLTVHLEEAIPGDGGLNYRVLLSEINKLDVRMPVMLEHLSKAEEYKKGADFVVRTAQELKIII